jgi:hypothetical protein
MLCTYKELESLSEPLRSKVELCKLAGWLGRMAVGRWEDWDMIDPAPGALFAKFGLRAPEEIIDSARSVMQSAEMPATMGELPPAVSRAEPIAIRHVSYANLSSPRGDLLPLVLASMGISVSPVKPDQIAVEGEIIINCLGVPRKRLEPYLGSGVFADRRCIIADSVHCAEYKALARTISLPSSYAAMRAACYSILGENRQDDNAPAHQCSNC